MSHQSAFHMYKKFDPSQNVVFSLSKELKFFFNFGDLQCVEAAARKMIRMGKFHNYICERVRIGSIAEYVFYKFQ